MSRSSSTRIAIAIIVFIFLSAQSWAAKQPEIVVRTIRVFAWIALSIGFSIIVWIIYAMLFAYR